MKVSQQVLEWQAEGRAEGELTTRRAVLLRALERRCKAPVPSDLAAAIQAMLDMKVLAQWFDAALEVDTFDEYRARTQIGRA